MQLVQKALPGLSLLVNLNLDRIFSVGAVVLALLAGAFLGSEIFGY